MNLGFSTLPADVFAIPALMLLAIWAPAIPQFLRFAVGLGVTRRTFYLASSLLGLVQALVLGSLFTASAVLERVTCGWGEEVTILSTDIGSTSLLVRWALSILVFLAAVALGINFGVAFARWRLTGVLVLAMVACVVLFALIVAVDVLGIGRPDVALLSLTVILGGAGYLMLRHAPV